MLQAYDLTIPQFDVLNAIHGLDEPTPKSIAGELLVTRGNVTGVLKRLQERRLIVTRDNPEDARSILCRLTAEGQALLEATRKAAAAFIAEQLRPFTDRELQSTERLMVRMRAHLQTVDADALAAGVAGR